MLRSYVAQLQDLSGRDIVVVKLLKNKSDNWFEDLPDFSKNLVDIWTDKSPHTLVVTTVAGEKLTYSVSEQVLDDVTSSGEFAEQCLKLSGLIDVPIDNILAMQFE